MSANTVHVKNISSATSEKEVKDFFSFCGKISNLEITPSGETQSATVTFEKETAAKTALLLDPPSPGYPRRGSSFGRSQEARRRCLKRTRY
jgi:RNA recognition motif-containing protein